MEVAKEEWGAREVELRREVEDQNVREQIGLPMIARRFKEAAGERNQYCVFQGLRRRRLPASAGIGQNSNQCCTELSPVPQRTHGREHQCWRAEGRKVKEWATS